MINSLFFTIDDLFIELAHVVKCAFVHMKHRESSLDDNFATWVEENLDDQNYKPPKPQHFN